MKKLLWYTFLAIILLAASSQQAVFAKSTELLGAGASAKGAMARRRRYASLSRKRTTASIPR